MTKQEECLSSECDEGSDLCSKLFGARKYKYSLQLSEEFPEVIYKERNFNIGVKLVDFNNRIVRNCTFFLIQLTSSTSAALFRHAKLIGSMRTEPEIHSWREKQKSNSIKEKLLSWNSTLGTWAGSILKEKLTWSSTPSPPLLNMRAVLHWIPWSRASKWSLW